jgi:hypothetical protein
MSENRDRWFADSEVHSIAVAHAGHVRFCKGGSVNVRFASKATEVLHCRELTRRAMCGRLRVGKDFLHECSIGWCGHVFAGVGGYAARFISFDQFR